MEHEDNAHFDNYLQSAQQNLQHGNNSGNSMCAGDALVMGSEGSVGCGAAVNAGDICVGSGGGKYEELDEHRYVDDESEWKYIKEMQQSEKELLQPQELAATQALHVGNGNSKMHVDVDIGIERNLDVDVDVDDEDDEDEDGGMPSMQYLNSSSNNNNNNNAAANGNGGDHYNNGDDEFDLIKTDAGDFSTTSNTISTADGGDIVALQQHADVLQVEMKIETQQQQQQQQPEFFEEEDPSSNGTSSLSEHVPPVQQQAPVMFGFDDEIMNDKENADPALRPMDLQFDSHASQLNPDAKEFVPSFSSNPASPTRLDAVDFDSILGQPQISAVSRHLFLSGDDDLVAHSPQKGRALPLDLDTLPGSVNEFEHEADLRPHELELEDEEIDEMHHIEFQQHENSQLAVDLVDHVLDETVQVTNNVADIDATMMADLMKQSVYVSEEDEQQKIENVLNSVQTLPEDIDSLNNSFVGDENVATPEEARSENLLQNHEDDKDHVSHPPSIEEMQLNLQNAANKDDMQIPLHLDMNSAAHMQESFYMEQQDQLHAADLHEEQPLEPEQQQEQHAEVLFTMPVTNEFNDEVIMPTSLPIDGNASDITSNDMEHEAEPLINTGFVINDTEAMTYDEHAMATNAYTPSPNSTVEEKHMLEDTKEQLVAKAIDDAQVFVDVLEKKMENLFFCGTEADLTQDDSAIIQDESIMHSEQQEQQHEPEFEKIDIMQVQAEFEKANEDFKQIADEVKQTEEQTNEICIETHINDLAEAESVPIVTEHEHVQPVADIIDEQTTDTVAPEAIVGATAAIAVAAAAATATVATEAKKSEVAVKKTTSTAAIKSAGKQPVAAKKLTTTAGSVEAKKPLAKTSTTTAAARPRTAPAKSALTVSKTVSVTSTTATVKKSPSATTTASAKSTTKPAIGKSSLGNRSSMTATATTTAAAAAAARKPPTTAAATTSPTAAKARATSAQQPAKPTSLGLTASKPKISPRATLTSQLRNKVGPPTTVTSTTSTTNTTVKSPLKASASMTNGIGSGRPLSASRSKTTTTATSTTNTTTSTTKTFTARPAPKTTSSVLNVAARRTASSTSTALASKTLKSASPVKSSATAAGKLTSPRTTASGMLLKTKTKEAPSAAKSPNKLSTAKKLTATAADAEKPKPEELFAMQPENTTQLNGNLHIDAAN